MNLFRQATGYSVFSEQAWDAVSEQLGEKKVADQTAQGEKKPDTAVTYTDLLRGHRNLASMLCCKECWAAAQQRMNREFGTPPKSVEMRVFKHSGQGSPGSLSLSSSEPILMPSTCTSPTSTLVFSVSAPTTPTSPMSNLPSPREKED